MTQRFEVQHWNTLNLLKVESLLLDFWFPLSHSFPASLKLIKTIFLGVGTCFTLSKLSSHKKKLLTSQICHVSQEQRSKVQLLQELQHTDLLIADV